MSRIITKTRTGNIISDEELGLEYLYVGDYGKENNIKASFLLPSASSNNNFKVL